MDPAQCREKMNKLISEEAAGLAELVQLLDRPDGMNGSAYRNFLTARRFELLNAATLEDGRVSLAYALRSDPA